MPVLPGKVENKSLLRLSRLQRVVHGTWQSSKNGNILMSSSEYWKESRFPGRGGTKRPSGTTWEFQSLEGKPAYSPCMLPVLGGFKITGDGGSLFSHNRVEIRGPLILLQQFLLLLRGAMSPCSWQPMVLLVMLIL